MTEETDEERAARHALNRPLEAEFRRLAADRDGVDTASAVLDAAMTAAAATQDAVTAASRAVATAEAVAARLAGEVAHAAAYHDRRYRIVCTSALVGLSGVAFWGMFVATHVALPLLMVAVLVGTGITVGGAAWGARATTRLYRAQEARLNAQLADLRRHSQPEQVVQP